MNGRKESPRRRPRRGVSAGGIAVQALVRAAWQAQWNQRWRFSRLKTGLWLGLLQAGAAVVMVWWLRRHPLEGSLWLSVFAASLQVGLASFLQTFVRGRERFYGGRVLPLIHVSPTPAVAVLTAWIAADLPAKVWSALLVSAAFSAAVPGSEWMLGAAPIFVATVVAGALGQLAGLLLLVAWVRLAPRALGSIWGLLLGLEVLLFAYVAYLVAAQTPLPAMVTWLQHSFRLLLGGLLLGIILPGLGMAAWFLAQPQAAGDAYRQGWMNLLELGEAASRPRRSLWLALAPKVPGSVQAKDWLQAARNSLTRVRLAAWSVGLVAIALAGSTLVRLPAQQRNPFALGAGTGLALFAFGEWVAALLTADGPGFSLYITAGTGPLRLFAGKGLAAAPFAILSGVGTWLSSLALGLAPTVAAALALQGTGTALGMTLVMLGLAAFDVRLRPQESRQDTEMLSVLMEQLPSGLGAWAGLTLAAGLGALTVWTAAGLPGGPHGLTPALSLGLLLLTPILAVAAGYLRLRQILQPRR